MSIVSTDWFLCLFATSLPPEVAVRVWDVLLFEGSKVSFLFTVLRFQDCALAYLHKELTVRETET